MSIDTIPVKAADGRHAGIIRGDIYQKIVHAERHMLKKPPAWCIDKAAYDKLIKPAGVKLIRFIDLTARKSWEVPLGVFDQNKGELDWKYGKQYFLILKHWRVRAGG